MKKMPVQQKETLNRLRRTRKQKNACFEHASPLRSWCSDSSFFGQRQDKKALSKTDKKEGQWTRESTSRLLTQPLPKYLNRKTETRGFGGIIHAHSSSVMNLLSWVIKSHPQATMSPAVRRINSQNKNLSFASSTQEPSISRRPILMRFHTPSRTTELYPRNIRMLVFLG